VRKKQDIFYYFFLDGAAVIVSWLIAVYLRYGNLTPLPPYPEVNLYPFYISVAILVTIGTLSGLGAYKGRYHQFAPVIKASLLTFLIGNVFFLYFKDYAFSRLVLLFYSILFLGMAISWRLVHYLLMDTSWGRVKFPRRTIIVGLGRDADYVHKRMVSDKGSSFQIVGFVGDVKEGSVDPGEKHILGPPEKLGELIRTHSIDEVIITQDEIPVEDWIRLVSIKCDPRPIFRIVPHGIDLFMSTVQPDKLDDFPSIQYLMDPLTSWEKVVKRVFDFFIAAAILMVVSPVFLMVSLLIKLESKGTIFYVQERVGKNGHPFWLYKFRSMIEDAEDITGPVWAEKDDKRVTKVGRFIRRTGIDELPQLFNVVRGEMSLVGPRPERSFFVMQHPELTQWRMSVRPGMTGLAQIRGRYDLELP
jgi:exopolysaccharide biosynthesis polyprenyl glycosylphosphotransferase